MTMTATEVWYASPDVHDVQDAIRYDRIASGPGETIDMLRDAEKLANERALSPDAGASRLLILIDQPGRLFSDERLGLLIQARAQSLTRTGLRVGVRLEIRW